MKLVKTASGKIKIKMSKSEWKSIGKKAGWISKIAQPILYDPASINSATSPEYLSEAYKNALSQSDENYRNQLFKAIKDNPNTPNSIRQKLSGNS